MAITEGVSDRTPRPLLAPLLSFDLEREAEVLRGEPAWQEGGHNARTLIKHSELRLVLIALAPDKVVEDQVIDERVCLHCLRGELSVHVPTEDVQLRRHGMLALDRKVPFRLQAVEDCDFLLWLGWSND